MLSAHQCIAVPLAQAMMDETMAELDEPDWVFTMAFMVYMDPSNEYFADHT